MRIDLRVLGILLLPIGATACNSASQAPVAETTTTVAATTSAFTPSTSTPDTTTTAVVPDTYTYPPPPQVTNDGDLDPDVVASLEDLWESFGSSVDSRAILDLGQSGDVRVAWLLSDVLRFVTAASTGQHLITAFTELTGVDINEDPTALRSPWQSMTNHLITWDLPTHPGYVGYKARLFTLIEPAWQPFFDDDEANIDWRITSWGGVLIDDRPLGDPLPCPRGCIPALDDPAVTSAAEGSWYPDDQVVFGVEVNGETRAYPKNQMEVHEMANDSIGGRRLGIPYCTLCGSAQAYFTDSVPDGVEIPVLRTSGLLTRSNKVMYDLNTFSIFDTFTGEALTGTLREQGITLEQTTVVTSTWGDWKAAHPETTIVAEDGGLGRTYALDPLRGRDDAGPIFPIGEVDDRLPEHAEVIGVITEGGEPIAFSVAALAEATADGGSVELAEVTITSDGSGYVAHNSDGTPLAAHQAFWFAWSQFHPDTELWP
ncbi:MAG: DUF3179 domain-containing (seleno)protein [Acidimicrobiia bacterium]